MPSNQVPVTMGSSRAMSLEIGDLRVHDVCFIPLLTLPRHSHGHTGLAVVLEGSFDTTWGSRTRRCTPATVMVEPAGTEHANRFESAGARVLVVEPDASRVESLEPCRALLRRPHHFRHGGLSVLAWQVARELQAPDATSPLVVEGLVLEMLAGAARLGEQARRERLPPPWLKRAQELLHSGPMTRVSVTEIAREVGVHPVHLARTFRTHYHVPLGTYQRRLRLEWARQALIASADPIVVIALAAGFADQAHFTRAFHGHTGFTPQLYRRLAGH